MKKKGNTMKKINMFDMSLISVIALFVAFIIQYFIDGDVLENCAVAGFMMVEFLFVLMASGIYYICKKPRYAFSKVISLMAIPMALLYVLIKFYPGATYPTMELVWTWIAGFLAYTSIALLNARKDYKVE